MPNRRNYQRELEQLLELIKGRPNAPTLLLHACCAPCSSYVLEYLSAFFAITVFYYNPNIYPRQEYDRRIQEERRLIARMGEDGVLGHPVRLIEGQFEEEAFYEAVRNLEQIPEGGERCFACFRLRLRRAAEEASRIKAEYVGTTLSISPLKNAEKLNEIGEEAAQRSGVAWLPSDFKKRGGYNRSIELSARYGLYRQDYCGCVFSKREREEKKRESRQGEGEITDGTAMGRTFYQGDGQKGL